MDTYLLLRNNKQSGPYSLQQLVSLGLKPYDLVWLEGRSAAWRYPSEVDGLKLYAPATEEQPYDRFYKKPAETTDEKPAERRLQPQADTSPNEQTYVLPVENKTAPQYEPSPKEKSYVLPVENKTETQYEPSLKDESHVLPVENKTATTSRKVFVAMPGNQVSKKPQPEPVKTPVIEKKPVIIEEKVAENKLVYTNETIAREQFIPRNEPIIPIVKEKPVPINDEPTLDEKYSESLDDIKKRYAETYLNRKKRSKWTSTHTSVLQVFGGAILFCTLVVIAYKNFAGDDQTQSRTTLIQPDKRAINTGTVTTTTTPAVIPTNTTEGNKPATKRTQTKKEEPYLSTESLAITTEPERNDGVVNEMAAVERKAVMPKITEENPEETKPKTRPVNINRLVSVRANNYKQRAFGGVMNLELTVNNDSKFELDKVTVELQYLKPSEQPIKTEIIVFNGVEANGSQTLKIPDYLRGVKVSYRVMEIESTQYDRQTVGL